MRKKYTKKEENKVKSRKEKEKRKRDVEHFDGGLPTWRAFPGAGGREQQFDVGVAECDCNHLRGRDQHRERVRPCGKGNLRL